MRYPFTGGDTEALIELATVLFAQKAIGPLKRPYRKVLIRVISVNLGLIIHPAKFAYHCSVKMSGGCSVKMSAGSRSARP